MDAKNTYPYRLEIKRRMYSNLKTSFLAITTNLPFQM